MLLFETNTPKIQNDLTDVIRLYFHDTPIKVNALPDEAVFSVVVRHHHEIMDGQYCERCIVIRDQNVIVDRVHRENYIDYHDETIMKRMLKRAAKLGIYYALKQAIPKSLPWGALTGIRPTSLYRQLDAEAGTSSAREQFQSILDVSNAKLTLVEEIIQAQNGIYHKGDTENFDIYIGIPFCPTRCVYCSFISHDLSKRKAPLEDYVDCVLQEIRWLKEFLHTEKISIRSVYVGGGTPTAIPCEALDRILGAMDDIIAPGTELTVEAGRADTLSDDIFHMLQRHGVNRVSINAQTMNDQTLRNVNRAHTTADTLHWLEKAKAMGFWVNMDLIMGLPGESIKDMEHSLDITKQLTIDNLTIHTLAVKRASRIKMEQLTLNNAPGDDIGRMVEYGRQTAYDMGMRPYYMYRQKYMSGNLENVGFSIPGRECIYNVDIMEETHNLIAIGAGAISKRMFYDINLHKRYANPKSVEHYIQNIQDVIRKRSAFFTQ